MEKLQKLADRLQASIDFATEHNEDFEASSWNYQEGVLLNHNEAKLVVELVKNLAIHNVMPRSLTAENGAKDLLRGEFVECFDPDDSGNPYIVPISWDSIKNIYKRIVDHYVA